jgi:hypothetical protein
MGNAPPRKADRRRLKLSRFSADVNSRQKGQLSQPEVWKAATTGLTTTQKRKSEFAIWRRFAVLKDANASNRRARRITEYARSTHASIICYCTQDSGVYQLWIENYRNATDERAISQPTNVSKTLDSKLCIKIDTCCFTN